MLLWALIFFGLAIIAGYFGQTGFASSSAIVGKILLAVSAALFLFGFVRQLIQRRRG